MADGPGRGRGVVAASLTSFVGRQSDLTRLGAALRDARLVTVTGPGGVGKTRIALAAADQVRDAFPGGTWLVELSGVADPGQVAAMVASALRVTDQSNRDAVERIVTHLAGAGALLLLDNCEHLLDASVQLTLRLLAALPELRILATSREALGIGGEQVYRLAPLAVPDDADAAGDQPLDQIPAVQLLADRARSVLAEFAVTTENREAVVTLCRQLDGLPLAIELAATRLRTLSVSQVVARLDRRFQLLAGDNRAADPRQRSLRALIDWSHELCDTGERLLWARLAVFPAPVDLETVERVCGFGELSGDRLLDALDRLIGKSVVVTDRDGERVRYRQFVSLREYGAELLARSGGEPTLRTRHRDHFAERAGACVARWYGPHQAEDLARLRADQPNLLAALAWSAATAGQQAAGARLAALLRYHWIAGGLLTDGRRWLELLLPRVGPDRPERGDALWVAAWVALLQGDRAAARRWLDECARIALALGDPAMRGHADHWRALLHLFEGDLPAATDLLQRAIGLHRSVADVGSELAAAFQLGMAQTYAGRPTEALATCADVIERAEPAGERWNRAYAHWVSAIAQLHLGNLAAATDAMAAAMTIELAFRDGLCTALCTEVLSWITAAAGRPEDAAALAGTAASVWHRIGTSLAAFGPHADADGRRYAARVDAALGRSRAVAIRERHGEVGIPQAVRLGLDVLARRDPARPPGPGPVVTGPDRVVLTGREREIAALIAQGLSNRAIAATLTISPRTVDGHVERILRKLDFSSRTQVAAWVTATGR